MMECIDKNLNPDEVKERISKFVLKEMDKTELDEFNEHLLDCDYCAERSLAGLKVKDIFEMRYTYEKLCAARNNKNWKEVISLSGEMEALGYSEEVHPIKEKVTEAKANLRLNKFSITINGERDEIEWENKEIVYPIPKSGKLTIEYGDKLLLDAVIGKDQLSQISIDQHVGFHHLQDKKLIFPKEQFDIEIIPGIEYKIVIKPKKKSDENE